MTGGSFAKFHGVHFHTESNVTVRFKFRLFVFQLSKLWQSKIPPIYMLQLNVDDITYPVQKITLRLILLSG